MLHHDIRASLLYGCMQCWHEWQIDPADEPSQTDAALAKRPLTRAVRIKRPRKV